MTWIHDVIYIINAESITRKTLESIIGRLNHPAYVIPFTRHFLNRLRQRLYSMRRGPRQSSRLDKNELEDLKLCVKFISQARIGISLNNLTIQQPSQLAISVYCPYGMGGFTFSGRAWRIPKKSALYGDCVANNFLEFPAMVVTIWLVKIECDQKGLKQECILGVGDNTSAICWLFKTKGIKK